MSTAKTLRIESTSSSATEQLAGRLGRACRGGEVIELISDLGGGKTTFVRGLARGLGSPDHVSSPTFKISNVYQGGKLELHHFDFYRLSDAGLMSYELQDVLGDPQVVMVVEWGDVVRHVLPEQRLTIRFQRAGEESRQLQFVYPQRLAYLLEELQS